MVQIHIRDSGSVGNLRLPLVACAGSVQSDWSAQEAPGDVKLHLFIVNNQTDRQDRHSNAQYDDNTGGT